MNDPRDFRYDQKQPPAGLVPIVGQPAPKAPAKVPVKTAKPKLVLTPEQEAKRKKMLEEMRQTVADGVPLESPLKEEAAPAVEPEAPAEPVVEEDPYKMTLMSALAHPAMKAIKFTVIGTGQCGSRIAEQFAKFGYDVVVLNTAQQDLAFVDLPAERKLLLDFALGGAGKDILVGQQAATANLPKIQKLFEQYITDSDQIMICTSGAGGSGAGSLIPLLQALSQVEAAAGLPVVVVYTLPMNDEGAQAKSNAVKTLERLAHMTNDSLISSLIIVDNAKIQQRHPDVSIKDFWKLANFDIVNLFNMFNTVSKCATQYDALDPMDFANILSTGGCLIYGRADIPLQLDGEGRVSLDEQKLAQAVVKSAQDGVLAEGFNITEAVRVGVIITGSEQVLSQIPAISINFAFNVLSEHVGDATIYKGLYKDDDATDCLSVFTIFAGLGLPRERIHRLMAEADAALQKIETKQKTKLVMDESKQIVAKDPYADLRQKNTPMGRMINRKRIR